MNMKATVCPLILLCIGSIVLMAGCETTPTQQGAIAGGALGAGAGAIIGNQSHHSGEGALIGAAAGALTGALVGDQVDEHRKREAAAQVAPPPPPPPAPVQRGHYETRLVTKPNGDTYEERVWVPDR
jgi:hypothetical protein